MELERWKDLRGVPLGTYEGVGCRVAEFEGLIENKLFWAKRRGIAVMLKVIWGVLWNATNVEKLKCS